MQFNYTYKIAHASVFNVMLKNRTSPSQILKLMLEVSRNAVRKPERGWDDLQFHQGYAQVLSHVKSSTLAGLPSEPLNCHCYCVTQLHCCGQGTTSNSSFLNACGL